MNTCKTKARKARTAIRPVEKYELMNMFRLTATAVLAALIAPSAALSHEMWLDAHDWQVADGAPVLADIRIGEKFEGAAYAYIPRDIVRFDFLAGGKVAAVAGRAGDRPAVSDVPPAAGLVVIAHVSSVLTTRYKEFAIFESFVAHKDLGDAIARHDARGLPREPFREAYVRYAKALVAVGDGVGADRPIGPEGGFETELVARQNPYRDDMSDGLDVTLYYQGKARPDARIEVFERDPDGVVSITTVRTDSAGLVTIPVRPGAEYMLDAVVLREPDPAMAVELDVLWESLWANLTFAVPSS